MATRDDILAAAQRLLNVEPTASTADLAAAAGIGRATLHRHFASREELLHEMGTRSIDRWEESLVAAGVEEASASDDPALVRACLQDMLARYVADSDDFGFALTDTYLLGAPDLVARSEALFEREAGLYAAGQRVGVLRDDVPARWLGHAVYGLLVAAREALNNGDVARRALDEMVLSTFLTGGQAR